MNEQRRGSPLKELVFACALILPGMALSAMYIVGTVGFVLGVVGAVATLLGIVVIGLTYLLYRPRQKGGYLMVAGVGIVMTSLAALLFQPTLLRAAVILLGEQETLDPDTTAILVKLAELLVTLVPLWVKLAGIAVGLVVIRFSVHVGRDVINVIVPSKEVIERQVSTRPSPDVPESDIPDRTGGGVRDDAEHGG